jgi:hypothetical protein
MNDLPKTIQPYDFHGVLLNPSRDEDQWVGDCPFCGREGKFSVDAKEGLWRCWVCQEGTDKGGGNIYTFLRRLHGLAYEQTQPAAYLDLARNRRLLGVEALVEWQIAKSPSTGEWLIPGYNAEGLLVGLYQWVKVEGRRLLMPTPGLKDSTHSGHSLHGVNTYDKGKPNVWLAEGWGDGLAAWEVLLLAKQTPEGLKPTASREASLLATTNVLAVPGEGVFFKSWLPLFAGKHVTLLYDNDHEKAACAGCKKSYSPHEHDTCPHCGSPERADRVVQPAGLHGMKRVASILARDAASIKYLRWGKDKDWDPALKSGYDLRDKLNA